MLNLNKCKFWVLQLIWKIFIESKVVDFARGKTLPINESSTRNWWFWLEIGFSCCTVSYSAAASTCRRKSGTYSFEAKPYFKLEWIHIILHKQNSTQRYQFYCFYNHQKNHIKVIKYIYLMSPSNSSEFSFCFVFKRK